MPPVWKLKGHAKRRSPPWILSRNCSSSRQRLTPSRSRYLVSRPRVVRRRINPILRRRPGRVTQISPSGVREAGEYRGTQNEGRSSSSCHHVAYFYSFVSRHGGVALYLSGQLASDLNMSHLQNMLAAGGYLLAALTSLISFLVTVHEQNVTSPKMAKPLNILTDSAGAC